MLGISASLLALLFSQPPATLPRYQDPHLPVAVRVHDLLRRMTPAEKFWQLYMAPGDLDDVHQGHPPGIYGLQVRIADTTSLAARRQAEHINAIQRYFVEQTRLGIPMIAFEEAVHGVVANGATVFPQAIGLAASWDTALMGRVSSAIGAEARARGIRQVLSPVVNLATDVRWGRTEETYGEDPWLAARMAVAYTGPIERAGVVTTVKHFVANVGDGGRDSYPIDLNERELTELHFPPFRAAIAGGGARSVMTAYNSVGGTPATQNRWLLTEMLRRRWRFGGVVISDQSATSGAVVLHLTERSTLTAARNAWAAGLEVVFQGRLAEATPYLDVVERGAVPRAVIDSAVSRVLRLKFELGLFEHPYVDLTRADAPSAPHQPLALEAARASIVLLKNDGRTLPLARTVRRVAVIGGDAVEARLGGYSGSPRQRISLLDGLRTQLGTGVIVRFAPGPGRRVVEAVPIPATLLEHGSPAQPGLFGEYFPNPSLSGPPALTRTDPGVDFAWTLSPPGPGIPLDWYGVRWQGRLRIPDGLRRIGVEGTDGYRLYLNDSLVLDRSGKESAGLHLVPVTEPAGTQVNVRLEFRETTGNGRIRLVSDAGLDPDAATTQVTAATALARESDVAILAAGIEEGEFRDRSSLSLPGAQEQLIRAVTATGTPTIVVLFGGSAITMSRWIDSVGAVIQAWYPGEQGGRAVAEVLLGDVNPAGRLPITFPLSEGQLPLSYRHKPTGRGDDYADLPGAPLFPFGYGMSYTSFEYSDLRVEPVIIGRHSPVTIRCRIRNVGPIAGDEVVQLYLRDLLASTARPVQQLAGFQRVHLAPGATAEVRFEVTNAQLAILDGNGRPVVEPGEFRIMVGASSRDIRLRGKFTVR